MKRFLLAIIVAFSVLITACTTAPTAPTGSIQVLSPWAAAANKGDNTAIFMQIKNSGSAADQLVKVETDAGMMVGLHQTVMKDNVMTMPELASIDIPANGQVELKSGSFHIMVMGTSKDLKAGDKVHVTLTFAKAGAVSVDAEVRNP